MKGGRNGTKSWGAARALEVKGFEKPLRILCARETQTSIAQSVHQLLKDQTVLLGLDGFYDVLQNEIRGKNGTIFSFIGLSNLTSHTIKSYEGYDICWVEEAALVTRRSWDILLPTIRKEGSEIWITFNPELDTDETWVRFIENTPDDCIVKDMSFDTNPWLTDTAEKERQAFLRMVASGARRQADYDNIWLGQCKPAVDGAIYPDEITKVIEDGRLCNTPYNPKLKVHTIWDLGWNDKMAIIFVQVNANAVMVIDYIEDSHRTYESYVLQIKAKEYNLSGNWLPSVDGTNHSPILGVSPIEYVNQLGLDADDKGVPNIGKKQGIEAARQMFHRVYFDKVKCTPLFNRLRRYARNINQATDEPMDTKRDDNAHGADAFRYLAVIESQLSNEDEDMSPIDYDDTGIV
jgi:phage terminase large subunit